MNHIWILTNNSSFDESHSPLEFNRLV